MRRSRVAANCQQLHKASCASVRAAAAGLVHARIPAKMGTWVGRRPTVPSVLHKSKRERLQKVGRRRTLVSSGRRKGRGEGSSGSVIAMCYARVRTQPSTSNETASIQHINFLLSVCAAQRACLLEQHVDAQTETPATVSSVTTVPFSGTSNLPCLLYTSPSPRDRQKSRMPSSA